MTVPAYPTLTGLTFPIIRTAEWDTDVQISLAGHRTAFARRAYPRYKYELTYTFLRTAAANLEWQTLLAFYNSVNGRSGLFTYIDTDDQTATTQLFGTGDGTTTQFQLVRAMTGNSVSFSEPVYAVFSASIFKNGALQTLAVNYTLSATGVVTFVSPPLIGDVLTWTGTYGWFCRFDDDAPIFEKFVYNIYEIKKVKFSTEIGVSSAAAGPLPAPPQTATILTGNPPQFAVF